MSDSYRDLHGDAYDEWKRDQADEYVKAQRRAFIDGFEFAANESQNFRLLREWLEQERDQAHQDYEEIDNYNDYVRYMAMADVLVKLSEMGCESKDGGEN